MPVQVLKNFLDQNGVKYVVISHSPAISWARSWPRLSS